MAKSRINQLSLRWLTQPFHPSQVEIANDVWAPSADEVDYAQRVIAAFEEATAEGRGVITVDGRMIENLHVDNARRVLAVQAAIESLS